MGSNTSVLLQVDIQAISSETGFTHNQIKRLYGRFTSMDKDTKGYLTKQDLMLIPELHVNPLRDRIIEVLIEDHGKNGKLNFRQFSQVFATFRRGKNHQNQQRENSNGETSTNEPNSKESKLRFLFRIYDRDKDERINKSELLSILNMLVGQNLPEDQMNALAERTIAELVTENEMQNAITYKKFCETLSKIDIEDKMSMKFLS